MKRAGGDALVLRTGESPHVLIGSGRQNVARAILSANALEALVTQIFSDEGRQTLRESGQVLEEVTVSGGLLLSAWAERTADQVTIELRECVPAPIERRAHARTGGRDRAGGHRRTRRRRRGRRGGSAAVARGVRRRSRRRGLRRGAVVCRHRRRLRAAGSARARNRRHRTRAAHRVGERSSTKSCSCRCRPRRPTSSRRLPNTTTRRTTVSPRPNPNARPGRSASRSCPNRTSVRFRLTRSPP